MRAAVAGHHLVVAATLLVAALGAATLSAAADERADRKSPASRKGDQPPPAGSRIEFRAARTTNTIRIDGVLDESEWSGATAVPLAFETAPGDSTPARTRTECLIVADRDALAFGCRAFDASPGQIRTFMSDRDKTEAEDRIGLVLDPFNDARRAFVFWVNAIGVQADALMTQDGAENLSWDAIWRSAGRLTDAGYVVEAAIPFRSLRFPSTSPQTWGFYFVRRQPRSELVETRSMRVDRGNSCLLCQTNLVAGLRGLSPGRNFDLTPTLTSQRSDTRELSPLSPRRPFQQGPLRTDVGLDVRWGIGPNLSVNATANPDFSQVEADTPQLDANSTFALAVEEKRPFFLESSDVFTTPIPALFTRSIADPVFGTKLTGKFGRNTLGVLAARDAVDNLLIPGSEESTTVTIDSPVDTVAGRYKRDVGGASSLGLLFTDRSAADYRNSVVGADASLQLARPAALSLQVLHSSTRYPVGVARENGQPAGGSGGNAVRAALTYGGRSWVGALSARFVDDRFRADAGFLPQVGIRGASSWLFRRFRAPAGHWYSRLDIGPFLNYFDDASGKPKYRYSGAVLQYEGPLQTSIVLNPYFGQETYQGRTFARKAFFFTASMKPTGFVSWDVTGDVGGGIDFTNVRAADSFRLEPSLALRLHRRLDIRLVRAQQRLSWGGTQILSTQASQLRAVYSFTPRSLLRTTVQWRQTVRNPAMQVDPEQPRTTSLLTQLLFSYKVNPQTVVFLGYSDGREGFVDVDFTRVRLTGKDRTVFLKLGYAWRP